MSTNQIIQAWKDEQFNDNLSEAELALLPQNPAGMLELTDEALEAVAAGAGTSAAVWCSWKVVIGPIQL